MQQGDLRRCTSWIYPQVLHSLVRGWVLYQKAGERTNICGFQFMKFRCSRGSVQHHLATRWRSFTPCTCQNKPVHRTVERWTSTVWLPASVTKVAFVQLVSLCYALNATTHSKDTVDVAENTSRFILHCRGTAESSDIRITVAQREKWRKENVLHHVTPGWNQQSVTWPTQAWKGFNSPCFAVIIMLTQFFMSTVIQQRS